jgi:hypothetical protein
VDWPPTQFFVNCRAAFFASTCGGARVPKRPPKLPQGSGSCTPFSPISEDGWRQIERTFGKRLSGDVRDAIFRATEDYVLFESTEQTAEPVEDAKKRIKALQKAATNLQSMIAIGTPSYALGVLITKHFQDARLSDKSGGCHVSRVDALNDVLGSFVAACEKALADVAPPGILDDLGALPSWEEGVEWKKWIRQLRQIMEQHGLPARTRKDAGNKSSGEHSPFTRFVWELQKLLPDGCDRSWQSQGALATAISRALRVK